MSPPFESVAGDRDVGRRRQAGLIWREPGERVTHVRHIFLQQGDCAPTAGAIVEVLLEQARLARVVEPGTPGANVRAG